MTRTLASADALMLSKLRFLWIDDRRSQWLSSRESIDSIRELIPLCCPLIMLIFLAHLILLLQKFDFDYWITETRTVIEKKTFTATHWIQMSKWNWISRLQRKGFMHILFRIHVSHVSTQTLCTESLQRVVLNGIYIEEKKWNGMNFKSQFRDNVNRMSK